MRRAGKGKSAPGNRLIYNDIRDVARANSLLEEASKPFGLSDMLGGLVPPKHFDSAEFTTYRPEPGFPSQQRALESVKAFTESIGRNPRGSVFGRIFAGRNTTGSGLYLDGGFGVGKTHLLASAFHAYHGRKTYLSFQELMFLVGLETLQGVV